MLQAAMLDGLTFDAFAFGKDLCGAAEVGIRRGVRAGEG